MDKTLIPCYEQAIRFLSIREHNVNELKLKLKQKGYDLYIIDKVITELLDKDYLSEERYIRSFVSSNNKRHPEGKSIILARLCQKGADRVLSKQVVNELYTPEYTKNLIEKAYDKILKQGKAQEVRIRLARLGFLSAEISMFFKEKGQN